ncbi:hypothetical protein QJQ45_029903, partial [Haematococcus lacustris]
IWILAWNCSGRKKATPAATSEPGPITPPPAKRSKRTKAEQAAKPTQPTKTAKAKPAAPKPSQASGGGRQLALAPRKPPQAPCSSQEATQPAASEPGPSTPPPAKRSKRTKAEQAAEPTNGTGKGKGTAAKAKPAPQPGRWLDRDCNAALNMQRIGESRWRPLELCWWPEHAALPVKGKEYPGLGNKRLRDKPPKAQEQQQPAEAHCEQGGAIPEEQEAGSKKRCWLWIGSRSPSIGAFAKVYPEGHTTQPVRARAGQTDTGGRPRATSGAPPAVSMVVRSFSEDSSSHLASFAGSLKMGDGASAVGTQRDSSYPFVHHATASRVVKGEDVLFVHPLAIPTQPQSMMYMVCDGHSGVEAANFVASNFLRIFNTKFPTKLPNFGVAKGESLDAKSLERNDAMSGCACTCAPAEVKAFAESVRKVLCETFVRLDNEWANVGHMAGTTVSVALCIGWLLTVANTGDSAIVLDTGCSILELTRSHRIQSNLDEQTRLKAAGQQLAPLGFHLQGPAKPGEPGVGPIRLWPGGLCVSRAVGDLDAGPEVVPIPHIRQIILPVEGCRVVMASDGLWDVLSFTKAIKLTRSKPTGAAASTLVSAVSRDLRTMDDASIVIIDILPSEGTSFPTVALKATPQASQKAVASSGLFSCFKAEPVEPDSRDLTGPGHLGFYCDVDCLRAYPGLKQLLVRSTMTIPGQIPPLLAQALNKPGNAPTDYTLHGARVSVRQTSVARVECGLSLVSYLNAPSPSFPSPGPLLSQSFGHGTMVKSPSLAVLENHTSSHSQVGLASGSRDNTQHSLPPAGCSSPRGPEPPTSLHIPGNARVGKEGRAAAGGGAGLYAQHLAAGSSAAQGELSALAPGDSAAYDTVTELHQSASSPPVVREFVREGGAAEGTCKGNAGRPAVLSEGGRSSGGGEGSSPVMQFA